MYKKIIFLILFILGIMTIFDLSYAEMTKEQRDEACRLSQDCLDKPSFQLNVSVLSPGGSKYIGDGSEQSIENILQIIVNRLMISFGILALLIMTVGGGFMIMHMGKEALLTKGKEIFMSGVKGLFIALSSGIIIKLIIYLIYA